MSQRGRARVGCAGLAAIAAVVLLASGCGYGGVATADSHPDVQNGQTLFASNCGFCHSLQAAGTSATIGPNLDNAFAFSADRKHGFAESTIMNVVLDQIRLGSGPIATYTDPEHGVEGLTPQTEMLPNIVRGQDAIDVAAYVASVAGMNGYVIPVDLASLTTGASIFKLGPCAGCHTLKAAGTTGTRGPNLDQVASQLSLAFIVDRVTDGAGNMPALGSQLTAAQIQAVAKYVLSSAGK